MFMKHFHNAEILCFIYCDLIVIKNAIINLLNIKPIKRFFVQKYKSVNFYLILK